MHKKGTTSVVPFFTFTKGYRGHTVIEAMQKQVTVKLEPSKIRPRENGRYFQKNHTAPAVQINFIMMENNEAVYRIKVKSDEKIATRFLKSEAKEACVSLRSFVRDILTGGHPSAAWLYELAEDWATRKGMFIDRITTNE